MAKSGRHDSMKTIKPLSKGVNKMNSSRAMKDLTIDGSWKSV